MGGLVPGQVCMGLVLVVVMWVLNWGLDGLRTHALFFWQWLGYCLVVDGWVRYRKGSSFLWRNPAGYAGLFVLSIPVWWMFEGMNAVTGNWYYSGREAFGAWAYFGWASLSFSTVMPAVFSTAELWSSFRWPGQGLRWRGWRAGRRTYWVLHYAGWLMLALVLLVPELFFPLVWLSWFFIIDPLNKLRGRPSLLGELLEGNGGKLAGFGLAALTCGFFWELWNLHAYPKWYYEIPYLEFWHIFEMPLAGYGGYIPFGWELAALYWFIKAPRASGASLPAH